MKKIPALLLVILLFMSVSCNFQQATQKLVHKDKDKFARQFIDGIITGDTSIPGMIVPAMLNDNTVQTLTTINRAIGKAHYKNIKVVGWQDKRTRETGRVYTISYEYEFQQAFALFSVALVKQGESYMIAGFNADMSRESYSKKLEFTFSGKGVVHYLVLCLALAIPVFVIATLFVLFNTPIRRKWLWIVAVVLCNFGATFYWTTGAFIWDGMKFIILGLNINIGTVSEGWKFTVALPVGAILFWLKRRKIKREEQEYNELIAMYPDSNNVT